MAAGDPPPPSVPPPPAPADPGLEVDPPQAPTMDEHDKPRLSLRALHPAMGGVIGGVRVTNPDGRPRGLDNKISIDSILLRTRPARERRIEKTQEEMLSRQSLLDEGERDLEQRVRQMREREFQVGERERELSERLMLIEARERNIAARESRLGQAGASEAERQAHDEAQKDLAAARAALERREQELQGLQAALEAAKKQSASAPAAGTGHSLEKLQALGAALAEREAMIAERESFIEESENTLFNKAQELQELETHLEQMQEQIRERAIALGLQAAPPPPPMEKL